MATAPTRPALRIPLHDDPHYYLRYWQEGDETALQRYANSHRIWDSVRDHFPHPYTLEHARQWIQLNAKPITSGVLVAAIGERILYPPQFAIVDAGNDEPIGAVGLNLSNAANYDCSAEVGYWLGEPFWGKGIVTRALISLTSHAYQEYPFLHRIWAVVYAYNEASARVLMKAGYEFEGRMRKAAVKRGEVVDMLLYAKVRE